MATKEALQRAAEAFAGTFFAERDRQERAAYEKFYALLAQQNDRRQSEAAARDAEDHASRQELIQLQQRQTRQALRHFRKMNPLEVQGAKADNRGQKLTNRGTKRQLEFAEETRDDRVRESAADARRAESDADRAASDAELGELRLELERAIQPAALEKIKDEELSAQFNFGIQMLQELRGFAEPNPMNGVLSLPRELQEDHDMWLRQVSAQAKMLMARKYDVDIEFPDGTVLQGGPSFGYVKLPGAVGVQGPEERLDGAGPAGDLLNQLTEELRGVASAQGAGGGRGESEGDALAASSEAETPLGGLERMDDGALRGLLSTLMEQQDIMRQVGFDEFGQPYPEFAEASADLRRQIATAQGNLFQRTGRMLGIPASEGDGVGGAPEKVSGPAARTRGGQIQNELARIAEREQARKQKKVEDANEMFYIDDQGVLQRSFDEIEVGRIYEQDPERVLDSRYVDSLYVGSPYTARFSTPHSVAGKYLSGERKRVISQAMQDALEGLYGGGT